MKAIGSFIVIVTALIFEIIGRVLHQIAEVALSITIMLLGIVSPKKE